MIVLDANVLVAQMNAYDVHPARIKNANLSDTLTNTLVFAEVANVLERRIKNPPNVLAAVSAVRRQIPIDTVSTALLDEGLALFAKHFGKLSFTDCVVLAQCRQDGHVLATLDAALAHAASSTGVKLAPL
jgi:predicted nucleic acid-binding protein